MVNSVFNGFYRGRRVFVTGHTGFKGSWLCQWLSDLGADVTGFSIDVPTEPSLFEELGLSKRIHHIVGDIRNTADVEKSMQKAKPEVIFHLAAQSIVRTSYDDPIGTLSTNVMGTASVLMAAKQLSGLISFINVTSDKCYENIEKDAGYRETDPMGGHDPYSASKGCAELVFSSLYRSFFKGQSKAALASVRAGNVIGGGDWAKDRIVPDCMRAWAKGQSVSVRNPKSIRPWQHVLESLSGYLWLAALLPEKSQELSGRGFNFGPLADVDRPVDSLVHQLQKTWKEARVHFEPSQDFKKEAGLLKLDCTLARLALEWEATLDFEKSVDLTAEWYFAVSKNPQIAPEITSRQIERYVGYARERGRRWSEG